MRNILLLILAVATGFMVACDDHDVLPPYTVSPIFNASTSMTHTKDTIDSKGDTIWLTARGGIADTLKKYSISATLKATDTTTAANLISGNFIKTVAVTYDTVGYANSKLFRWTTASKALYITIPAVAAKTKIKTTSLFTYSLTLSSQTGNQTGTDSKFVYAK